MILVIGPLFAGKREYIQAELHLPEASFSNHADDECPVVYDAQELAVDCGDLAALADTLAKKRAVICTEVGGGVVPLEAEARAAREAAGRLTLLLAERAERVVRVFCGLPQVIREGRP